MDANFTYTISATDGDNAIELIHVSQAMIDGRFSLLSHASTLISLLAMMHDGAQFVDSKDGNECVVNSMDLVEILDLMESTILKIRSIQTKLSKQQS